MSFVMLLEYFFAELTWTLILTADSYITIPLRYVPVLPSREFSAEFIAVISNARGSSATGAEVEEGEEENENPAQKTYTVRVATILLHGSSSAATTTTTNTIATTATASAAGTGRYVPSMKVGRI